jgi:cytochrome c peroxidase
MKRHWIWICALAVAASLSVAGAGMANTPTLKQILGGMLYADESLSLNKNQSCMTCHHPVAGFVDPANVRDPEDSVVSTGSDGVSLGGREAPTAAYAVFSPPFYWDDVEGMFMGGQFWDGRAATLKDQAKGPFLNPLEMAMPSKDAVVQAVKDGPYEWLFKIVFGRKALNDVEIAYDHIAEAIADFEGTQVLNRFSSKYDDYLAGKAKLTKQEKLGLQLFEGKAGCSACHPSQPTLNPDGTVSAPLFTDFSYDNLGIPKSTNPQIASNPVDYGLGGRQNLDPCVGGYALVDGVNVCIAEAGKFKVPTLRNLSKTAPYGHNGYFPTLKGIVRFYNTAGIPGMWPAPEVDINVNRDELGDLKLTNAEVDAVVAFLKTLTDR